MKNINFLNPILLVGCIALLSFKANDTPNLLTFGGKSIAITSTDCSTDNSSDGKSRAIVAINATTASACTIQFAVVSPTSGTFITAEDADALKAGEVALGVAGDDFDGNFIAKKGQVIAITNNGGKYHASFKDITMTNDGKDTAKKLTGDFGCK
jgi:hypothetical protein